MTIEILAAEDVKSGRTGTRTHGEKYSKYTVAIKPMVDRFKDEIAKSTDAKIRVRIGDLKQELGLTKNETSVYWGLKYSLFKEGIVVETGTHKDGSKVLVMRTKTDTDMLPASLAKYMESNM